MKIDQSNFTDPEKNINGQLGRIVSRTLLIIIVMVIGFYIAARFSEQFGDNYLKSHFFIDLNSRNMDDRVEIPSLKFTAELDLKDETHDNYLNIALSGGDVYKVEFLLEDKSDFILISTAGRGDQSYLYFIPDPISTRGYRTIKISAMRGDGDYWIQNISTTNDPDFIEFPDHEIVDFEIKKMEIEIGEDEYSKIKAKRERALELGILLTEDADYVPAVITADGKKDDIEIRLKGDWTDHLAGGKWSFRIKMDDESVWGMKKFSIHRPETRDGVSEYLVQTFYRDHGGIALRYDFIDVLINGEYMGVYGIEEFFDKRLVENAFFREGPIIKVNEDYLWERRTYYYGRIEDWDFGLDPDARYMDFDVFGINQTLESEMLTGYTAYAITELNKLMAGQVAVEDIFEIEQFAKYFAILDIFNSCHGNIWHNMRYYFNPVTAKMEPITFDELPKEGLCDSSSKRNDPLIAPFFKNADFSKLYIKYLDQYIDEYDTFLEKEAYNLARIQTIFQRDGIYYKDYTTHLDELHYFIDSTLFEDDYKFRIERVSDSKLAIKINKKGYMGIQMETVSYDGQPVNARFTDYQNRVAVIEYAQPTYYDDLSKFTVTYITLKDGITHTESVANPEFDFAFYTAGHIYGSHDKAGSPEQDYIHPPFAAALPGIAENEDIAFGVLAGDTVYEPSATSFGNLKAAMEITGKPYYIAPGNHDLDGSGLFSANFGSTNQSFVRGNALFIILTPRANWELDAEQLAFLDQTLQENQDAVSSIFILTHYLFWLDGEHFSWVTPNGGPYKENKTNFWTDVTPEFDDFEGDIYFIAGDVGAFPNQDAVVYEREGNMHFIASGLGGGTEDNYLITYVFDDGSVEFKLVSIDPEGPISLGYLTRK